MKDMALIIFLSSPPTGSSQTTPRIGQKQGECWLFTVMKDMVLMIFLSSPPTGSSGARALQSATATEEEAIPAAVVVPEAPHPSRARICLKATFIGFACLFVLAVIGGIIASLNDEIMSALYWCKDHTPLSALLYGLIVVVATILGLPVMFLEIGCGFIFGFGGSILTLSIAKPLGAAGCYVFGKLFFKGFASRLVASSPKTKSLFTAIEQQPWKLLLLLRVALMPGVLKNYGVSMINCPFHIFFISCLIGDLPYTLLWSYLGSRGSNLTAVMAGVMKKTPAQSALSLLGVVFLVVLFVTMKRSVDRVMEETMQKEQREHPEFDEEV